MRLRLLVATLALFSIAAKGMVCPAPVALLSPTPGSTVTTFSFEVEISVSGKNLDGAGMQVTLNGEPLAVVEGPPGLFTATVNAGEPLRDSNLILAQIPRTHGRGTFKAKSFFRYLPPKARARQITSSRDLLSGPLAHGQLGDFLIENSEARFVVQRANQRDLHSIGQFGGTLIDAELTANPDTDSFFEITPAVNIETVINATDVAVVNDGQNGLAAIVRACGPDDLLDYVNASAQVAELSPFPFPPEANDNDQDVEGCTDYVLEPLVTNVRMETTIFNNESDDLGLFVGDYINGMGQLEQWTRQRTHPTLGDFDAGIGEILATAGIDIMSFFGFGSASGVSYFRVGEPVPGSVEPDSSFSTSGVSFVMAGASIPRVLFSGVDPTFTVPAGGQNTFTRHFGVGSGSGADAVPLVLDTLSPGLVPAEVSGCVTVAPDVPAARARIAAAPGAALDNLAGTWVADEAGCFAGELAPGNYSFAAARGGTPYQGGGTNPVLQTVSLAPGANPPLDFLLPATGRVRVMVTDEASRPLPARVTVVGFDPSPEVKILFNFFNLLTATGGAFNDITKDPLPFGIAALAYSDASGLAEFDLEPGSYELFVSRGTEYSIFRMPLTTSAGNLETVEAQIAHVLDTSGFISSDYHVHMIDSPDSRISKVNRVMQFAGEGVDNLIATDHDARTDLRPTIASLGLQDWLHTTVGEETTTFDTGHYNSYPLGVDEERVSRGSVDWGGAAPPGQDFPSNGYYILSPAEIAAEVQGQLDSRGGLLNPSADLVTQINHIDSHFGPLRINSAEEPPRSFLTPAQARAFRLDPLIANFFHHFPALELWNGANRSAQTSFLRERIGIWFNHLNQGLRTTFIADTDTHTFLDLETAGARTWTPSSVDAVSGIDDDEIGAAVKAGRAVGGQGVYVQIRLREADNPGNEAHFGLGGSTDLDTQGDPNVELIIDVQAPSWVEFDTIQIFANSPTRVTGTNAGVPVLFRAVPDDVLCLDPPPASALCGGLFSLPPPTEVVPSIPGATRQDLRLVLPYTLTEDTWFAVVVLGSDGVSEPMFPVYPRDLNGNPAVNGTLADLLDGNLGEGGTMALGATNALYANVDGDEDFDPPGVRVLGL